MIIFYDLYEIKKNKLSIWNKKKVEKNDVTSHLNNTIIKWNLTPDNIKSQVAYSYPRYLKENTKAHYKPTTQKE